jgi:hypothetical protein
MDDNAGGLDAHKPGGNLSDLTEQRLVAQL